MYGWVQFRLWSRDEKLLVRMAWSLIMDHRSWIDDAMCILPMVGNLLKEDAIWQQSATFASFGYYCNLPGILRILYQKLHSAYVVFTHQRFQSKNPVYAILGRPQSCHMDKTRLLKLVPLEERFGMDGRILYWRCLVIVVDGNWTKGLWFWWSIFDSEIRFITKN